MNIDEIKGLCMVWETYTGRLPPHIQDYNTLFAEIDRLKKRLEPIERVWEENNGRLWHIGSPEEVNKRLAMDFWQAIKESMEVGDEG